jgi:hypothetical protein
VAEAESINCDGGGPLVETIDGSKLTHHGFVDIVAPTPVLDALAVALFAIQNPVYVA